MATPSFSLSKAREYAQAGNSALSVAHFMAIARISKSSLTTSDINSLFIPHLVKFCSDLEERGDIEGAEEFYSLVCESIGPHQALFNAWGEVSFRRGHWNNAADLFIKALDIDSETPNLELQRARKNLSSLRSHFIDQWHFRMLNDYSRNSQYHKAIDKAVKLILSQNNGQCSVLDIGSGSGLLSLLCARSGATQVFACEASPILAGLSNKIIEDNKFPNIRVLNKVSFDLSVPLHIPEKVDLIVTELMDAAFFGEAIVPSINDAKKRLLKLGGKIIPNSAKIYICAVQSPSIRYANVLDKGNVPEIIGQQNLDSVSKYVSIRNTSDSEEEEPYQSEYLNRLEPACKFISKTYQVCEVNFKDDCLLNMIEKDGFKKTLAIDLHVDTNLDALVSWFEVSLDGDAQYKLNSRDKCCWEQAVFPINHQWLPNTSSISVNIEIKNDRFCVYPIYPENIGFEICSIVDTELLSLMNDSVYSNAYRFWMQSLRKSKWFDYTKPTRVLFLGSNPILALMARSIFDLPVCLITNSGQSVEFAYSEKLNLHELTAEEEANLSETSNILLFEIIDSNGDLIGDGVFEAVAYWRMLCEPWGNMTRSPVVPSYVHIWACAVQSHWLHQSSTIISDHNTMDCKLQKYMNSLSVDKLLEVNLNSEDVVRMSNNQQIMLLDLNETLYPNDTSHLASFLSQTKEVNLIITQNGFVDAVVVWFDLSQNDSCVIYSASDKATNCKSIAYMMHERKPSNTGDQLKFTANLNQSCVDLIFSN